MSSLRDFTQRVKLLNDRKRGNTRGESKERENMGMMGVRRTSSVEWNRHVGRERLSMDEGTDP